MEEGRKGGREGGRERGRVGGREDSDLPRKRPVLFDLKELSARVVIPATVAKAMHAHKSVQMCSLKHHYWA